MRLAAKINRNLSEFCAEKPLKNQENHSPTQSGPRTDSGLGCQGLSAFRASRCRKQGTSQLFAVPHAKGAARSLVFSRPDAESKGPLNVFKMLRSPLHSAQSDERSLKYQT